MVHPRYFCSNHSAYQCTIVLLFSCKKVFVQIIFLLLHQQFLGNGTPKPRSTWNGAHSADWKKGLFKLIEQYPNKRIGRRKHCWSYQEFCHSCQDGFPALYKLLKQVTASQVVLSHPWRTKRFVGNSGNSMFNANEILWISKRSLSSRYYKIKSFLRTCVVASSLFRPRSTLRLRRFEIRRRAIDLFSLTASFTRLAPTNQYL